MKTMIKTFHHCPPSGSAAITRSLLLAVTALMLPRAGFAQEPAPEPETQVEASATDALKDALADLKAVKGLEGAERDAALDGAADSLEALFSRLEGAPALLAQASYEAGECRRRLGDLETAEANFTRCLEAQAEGRYVERAWFQRASMRRRSGRIDDAIADYRKAASVRPDSARAHEARIWVGRCLVTAERSAEALQAFQDALTATEDPVRRIDASDRIASVHVQQGDLDAARKALDSIESEVAPIVEAGGKLGERVRKALERRSSVKKVRQLADQQNDAAGDAARLERDRARRTAGR